MDTERRIRLAIGDLVVQLHAAFAKIEELEAKLKELDDHRIDDFKKVHLD